MAYSADFWVAIATIAPVLALANTVLIGTYAGPPISAPREITRIEPWLYRLSLANYLVQALTCVAALISLQRGHNAVAPTAVVVVAGCGMVLIGATSALSGYSRKLRTIYNEGRELGRQRGYAAGFPDGFEAGYPRGFRSGQAAADELSDPQP